jgi:hypothetical protein
LLLGSAVDQQAARPADNPVLCTEPDRLREPPCAQFLRDRCVLFSIQPVSTEEHAGERAEQEKQSCLSLLGQVSQDPRLTRFPCVL